jgi:hypothetical protein
MAEFIGPVIDDLIAIVKKYTPAALAGAEPFLDFGKAFTGVVPNIPAVWVMPGQTLFDPDSTIVQQQHRVTVRFAVDGSEPDRVEEKAVLYMKVLDGSIRFAAPGDWTVVPMRVFIQAHDYGPLYSRGGVPMKLPELHLLVEVNEL